MSYRLENGESLPDGLKRIAGEQIDEAEQSLRAPQEGRDEAVHDARKRFKKVRAVLRLVRDEIGEETYQRENVFFRDLGRQLAEVRESAVTIETLDSLIERYADQLAADAFEGMRAALVERHEAIIQRILGDGEAMEAVADKLADARSRIEALPIRKDGFSAIEDGLKRVYRRGYKGRSKAYREPEPENFHEWRKRVKYLWYHSRILRPLWSEIFAELAEQIHDLSDYLGDAHDYAEFNRLLAEQGIDLGSEREVRALAALSEARRKHLEIEASPLGARIYAEKPKRFVKRWERYWEIRRQTEDLDQPINVI